MNLWDVLRITVLLILSFLGNTLQAQLTEPEADATFKNFQENSFSVGQRDTTIGICHNLIEFYQKIDRPCKQARVMGFLALLESAKLDHKEAIEAILKARKYVDNSGCKEEYTVYLDWVLAEFYWMIGESERSDSLGMIGVESYQDSWEDQITRIKLHLTIANNATDIVRKLNHLEIALNLSQKYKVTRLEQISFINLAGAYASSGMYPKAREYCQKALRIAKKRNSFLELSNIYNILAGISSNTDEIKNYLDSATYYAGISGNLKLNHDLQENKAYFYYQNGDYQAAYDYLWSSIDLKDSLFNIQKFEAIANLEKRYETEKRENEIEKLKVEKLNTELEASIYKRNQNILILGSILLILMLASFVVGFITIRKNRNQLAEKNIEIEEARNRSDELLLNILPEEIAEELKATGKADARDYKRVSILFTDFIEFTQISERLSTTELVNEVNTCFKRFDEIVDEMGIEKIKTIGDSYMAAGDLPVPTKDSVASTVLTAIKMQEFMVARKKAQDIEGMPSFEMRAGIHTGPVVAGIVGVKKFQYDIWGDTVNTASRMENNGDAGKVNISKNTYELIKEDARFTFTYRGLVEAKGKGTMEMYFVETVKTSNA